MTFFNRFTFSNFYLDFYFPFLFGLLFLFSIWTFISLFYLEFLIIFFLYFFFNSFSNFFSIFFYSIAVTFWISSNCFIFQKKKYFETLGMCKRKYGDTPGDSPVFTQLNNKGNKSWTFISELLFPSFHRGDQGKKSKTGESPLF